MCLLMLRGLVELLHRLNLWRSHACKRKESDRPVTGDLAATSSTIPAWLNQWEEVMTHSSIHSMNSSTPLAEPEAMVMGGSSNNCNTGSRVHQTLAGAGVCHQNDVADPAMCEE